MQVDETRSTDKTVSLIERTNLERKKKYDFFISIHRNAFQPEKGTGAETFIYSATSKKAAVLAADIQNALIRSGFANRGVKTANFHVLEKTSSPALLLEVGFIDNTNDNKLFDTKFDTLAKSIAKAIISSLGIKNIEHCIKCGQKILTT